MSFVHLYTWLLFFFIPYHLTAQEYFQQDVDYRISATVDDDHHSVTGEFKVDYTNNSPVALTEMYFHLWPNAYSSKSSAFANQQLEFGSTAFYFAPDSLMGNISELDFKVDGKQVKWDFVDGHPDVVKLVLIESIDPGESASIETPYHLKLPAVFSRLGYEDGAYHMTQWYPKPAVFDRDGWHPMPYLDMGEFYSEFGSFEVEITLPSDFVVAATGSIQETSEQSYIQKRIEQSSRLLNGEISEEDFYNAFAEREAGSKTITFKAENVHDFAWFASRDFMVENRELTLANGNKVQAYSYYPPSARDLWQNTVDYVVDATQFFSEHVGDYPYPQVSAVRSHLSAGGGMEYPMITVIDDQPSRKALDGIIAHEVGHNWFYSALGSNERDHPWMDEGINSYYEQKYLYDKYRGEEPYSDMLPIIINEKDLDVSVSHYLYLAQARRNLDQESGKSSQYYNLVNYMIMAYQKPALCLGHLESYLGSTLFEECMKSYFDEWSGKHPKPEDFENAFKSKTSKDLSWFFDDLLQSNKKIDYRLNGLKDKGGKTHVNIQNIGEIDSPVEIFALKDGEVVYSEWIEGFTGIYAHELKTNDFDYLALDYENKTLDLVKTNNNLKRSGILRKSLPTEIKLGPAPLGVRKNRINVIPALGGNAYDKFMLGAWISNPIIPEGNFHYSFVPMYAFGTKDLTGLAHLHYSLFPGSNIFRRIQLGTSLKSFHFDTNKVLGIEQKYSRISPFWKFDFVGDVKKVKSHYLKYTAHIIGEDFVNFNSQDSFEVVKETSLINRLSYRFEPYAALNPWSIDFEMEHQGYKSFDNESQSYLKVSATYNVKFNFQHKKSIDFRVYGSFFPVNSQKEVASFNKRIARGSNSLLYQGFSDYGYDNYFFGRSEQDGIWSRQVFTNKGGGFKNATTSRYSIGQTNDFAFAINVKSDLPMRIPFISLFKPYLDIAYYNRKTTTNSPYEGTVLYSGGFLFETDSDFFSIHFPLFYSDAIKTAYNDLGGFGARISFHLDIDKLNPYRLLDEFH